MRSRRQCRWRGYCPVRQLVAVPVRFLPLGSPWAVPKRSYVHVRRVPRVHALGVPRSWCTGVGAAWVGTGEGTTHPGTHRPQIGIARTQPPACPRICVHSGTPGPLLGPSAHLSSSHSTYPPQDQYRRDLRLNILKLVINPECRPNSVMRPGILPISETRPKVTTLKKPGIPYSPSFSHKE